MKRGRSESLPVAARGWRSGCPVCGHFDKVRLLDAVYQDRERRWAEQPPLVNRFGLMLRGHPALTPLPRAASRLNPPRRPSVLGTFMRIGGPQVAGLLGVPFGVALLIRPGTFADFLGSLVVAGLLGALSVPLAERGRRTWAVRTAEWEQAMRAWRALRYCSRCDQVFAER